MGLTVAHRALVAYEQFTGRYDVHTSRWGGLDCGLASLLSPADPFGGGAVDSEARVYDRPFESVLTMVDFASHEALYRVSTDFEIQAYRPLWFGLAHYLGAVDDSDPSGVLVAVESVAEARELSAWLRAAKGVLADAVTAGYLTVPEALDVLAEATRRRAGGRAVLDPDGLS